MRKATDNEANAHYNDESLFLDGIVESHPEIYNALSEEDRQALQAYYLVAQPVPENIFEFREKLIRERPGLQERAKQVFDKLLTMLDIEKFEYSTKPRTQ